MFCYFYHVVYAYVVVAGYMIDGVVTVAKGVWRPTWLCAKMFSHSYNIVNSAIVSSSGFN